MKKRLWIGVTATAIVTAAVILGLLFFGGFFLSKEAKAYNRAVDRLKENGTVTLEVTQKTTTRVGGDSIPLEVEQVLSYSGADTRKPQIKLEEEVVYRDALDLSGTSAGEAKKTYTEYYHDGTLYVEFGQDAAFTGQLTRAEAAIRYVPVGLLNARRYKKVTLETEGDMTTISFASPKSGESWAVPVGAELLEASGFAKINAAGEIRQMYYTVTYRYGTAEITKDVYSVPCEGQPVQLPEQTDKYVPLQYADALRMFLSGNKLMTGVQTATVALSENIVSQAAAFAQLQNSTMEVHDTSDGLLGKMTMDQEAMNGSGSESNTYDILYKNGKYTVTENGKKTTTYVKEAEARETLRTGLNAQLPDPKYWEEAVLTELNGIYFLEYTFTETFGNHLRNTLSQRLFNDAQALDKMASKYKHKEATGYMAIDAYTGLVTGTGISYEGIHTIEGQKYSLILQMNQSLELPSPEVYASITGEQPKEAEPEEKATPLFYRVTGKDGQEMWLLGTIHIGDARTAYLPEEIYDAFADSDALALEIDAEKFEEQLETDTALQEAMAEAYFYDDGSEIEDHLDDEVYELALKYMKASGNYNHNAPYMKTSVWESAIGEFFLQLGHSLSSDKGVEMRLTELAKAQNKPIREVESGQAQIQMLTGWSDELQEMLLASTLGGGPAAYNMSSEMLYELWCAGDEKALRKQVNIEGSTAGMSKAERKAYEEYMEEYDRTMNTDRNAKMVNVAISYLESGETVFYAVGLAHLLDDTNGLVDALRQAGYTVERVRYS